MEITKALEELRENIESPKQFLGITFGLNKEECAVLIRRIHALLPEQVKQASAITRESERIVGTAREDATVTLERARAEAEKVLETSRKEAQRIIEQAAVERDRAVSESEIMKMAKQQAEHVKRESEEEAARLRRGADDYALEVLMRLESVVGKVMATIERGKSEIDRPQQAAVAGRPK